MRSNLLPTAIAAVVVTFYAPLAIAKVNDRLAQKFATTDEGASPPGDYSGGELGWGDGTGDDADGDGDLLRFDEGDPIDIGEGEGDDLENALAENGWPYGSSYIDMYSDRVACTGVCTALTFAGCGAITTGVVLAGIASLGSAAMPAALGGLAACAGLAGYTMDRCEALCRSKIH